MPALGATVLYGEIYWAKNLDRNILPADPVTFGRDYRELGLYAGITQELGPHAAAGIRYDFYNPDADSANMVMGSTKPTALSYQTVAFAAALRAPAGRLIAEFDLNRNHNGRDALGNPDQPGVQRLHAARRGQLLMRPRAHLFHLCLTGALAGGCGGASADPGLSAYLRLSGAQYVPGALDPTSGATAPAVTAVNVLTTTVAPGLQNLPFSGDVDNGTSALVGLAGRRGSLDRARHHRRFRRPRKLHVQHEAVLLAGDPAGRAPAVRARRRRERDRGAGARAGPDRRAPATPTGALVISLTWDTQSDLDLHVLAPNPDRPDHARSRSGPRRRSACRRGRPAPRR